MTTYITRYIQNATLKNTYILLNTTSQKLTVERFFSRIVSMGIVSPFISYYKRASVLFSRKMLVRLMLFLLV